jgi:predicted RNA binding protein YcfA (HicA-like mRNA interferase family)
VKYRDIIKLLEEDGWQLERTKGSHRVYKHVTKSGIVVVAAHKLSSDVPPGTANSIMKQAGLR